MKMVKSDLKEVIIKMVECALELNIKMVKSALEVIIKNGKFRMLSR